MKRLIPVLLVPLLISACIPVQPEEPPSTPTLIQIENQPTPTISLPSGEGVAIEQLITLGDGGVFDAAWSPDGRYLALATTIGVKVYLAENLEMVRSLSVPGLASSVAFSPDGRMIAAGTANKAMGTRDRWRRFSPWGSRGSIIIWDTTSGEQLAHLDVGESYVTRVKFSPDSQSLAAAYMYPDSAIRVWDVSDAEKGDPPILRYRITKHTRGVFDLDYSSNGDWLLSGSGDNSARIWNADDGTLEEIVVYLSAATLKVYSVAITEKPDGDDGHDWIAAVAGTKVMKTVETQFFQIIDPLNGEVISELEEHKAAVDAVAFSPDGKIMVSGSAYPESYLKIWETSSMTVLHTIASHKAGIRTLVFSPDGTRMASTGWDNSVVIWDTSSWQSIGEIPGHNNHIWDAVINPDGSLAATAGDDGYLRIYDLSSGSLQGRYFTGSRKVTSTIFSQDGKSLFAGTGAPNFNIQQWSLKNGSLQETYTGHTGEVEDLAISSDGRLIASAGGKGDSKVILWDTRNGNMIQTFEGSSRGNTQVVIGESGKWVVAGDGNGGIHLWDTDTSEITWELLGAYDCGITTIDLEENEKFAAIGDCSGNLLIWKPFSNQPRYEYPGGCDNVLFSAFQTGSGNMLVNCDDRSLRYWETYLDEITLWLPTLPGVVMDILWRDGKATILLDKGDGMLIVLKIYPE